MRGALDAAAHMRKEGEKMSLRADIRPRGLYDSVPVAFDRLRI